MDERRNDILKAFHLMVALDPKAAVRQRLVAIPDIGSVNELDYLAIACKTIFANPLNLEVRYGHVSDKSSSIVSSSVMAESPKVIVYSDTSIHDDSMIVSAFERAGHLIEFIREDGMYNSLFISYGGPDELTAQRINSHLKAHGVRTWFFPEDALPGQKLHRVMSEGVANHDRVLLMCSRASLGRNGVLNEIERVLEREARDGGAEILIPVSLDDYVFSDWAPSRMDIAQQIRARVISRFPTGETAQEEFEKAANRLLQALKRHR